MWRELQAGDPELIGPYRLRGLLGTGGMGRVFLGVSAGGRPVAVKVIRAALQKSFTQAAWVRLFCGEGGIEVRMVPVVPAPRPAWAPRRHRGPCRWIIVVVRTTAMLHRHGRLAAGRTPGGIPAPWDGFRAVSA